jgi:hypothetical protein
MAWNWSSVAQEFDRDKLAMMLAVGDATVARLELYGVVRANGDGRVAVSIDWMDEARADAFEKRQGQSRAGKASAERRYRARPDRPGGARSTSAERPFNAGSAPVQPEEEKRGDKTRCSPDCAPGSHESPTPAAGAGAPDQLVRTKTRPTRVAETWQKVLTRPEYEPLRRHAGFMAAWSQWIEWCGTRGAKARPPVGVQVVKMLNRALEDPGLYARAIALSIERNYAAVDPTWIRPPLADARLSFVPKSELAASRAIALSRAARAQSQGGTQ